MNEVLLYDTTLRDGTQREGLSISCADKLKIVKRLDRLGFQYIEGGWPGSNPKDAEFFERVRTLQLEQAKICAFGSTRRKNTTCKDDPNTRALVAAQTPVVTLVGKSWDLHVEKVLETSLEENLAMIGDSVRYHKDLGKEVVYDAEHFFDGFKANSEYALAVLQAAAEAGADHVVVCDTNGGSLPWEIEEIVSEVKARVQTPLGIHAHNDSGCGVANSLAAVRAGCLMVQGTINGYGERVGNGNLSTIVPDLQLKMGRRCVSDEQLANWTALSRFVAEVANVEQASHAPFVGHSAFAHKGGIHVAAVLKVKKSYEHIDPATVGNETRSVVSELAGRGNVVRLATACNLEVQPDQASALVATIKKMENQGYSFEGADASVELMMHRNDKTYETPFELIDYMVVVEHRQGRGLVTEATVKVLVSGDVMHAAAEGNGPVNALGRALRRALHTHYPEIAEVHLTDYKVRIVDGEEGTAAKVRVLIDFRYHDREWATVGASTSIVDASWIALSESLEYALLYTDRADTHGGTAFSVTNESVPPVKKNVDMGQTAVHNHAP